MKKIKIIGISLLLIAIIGFAGYNYIMHGGARDLSSEETSFKVTSKQISTEFITNTDTANKKYLEKAVAISGTVTGVTSSTEIIIDNNIICKLKNPDTTIKKDQNITIKGRVIGFDDLMGEIRLDNCFVL